MSKHNEHSSYREKLIEHLFFGELLKLSWLHENCSVEIAKPEVDNAGYDIIAEANRVVRHIQLKSSHKESSTASQKLHIKLAEKPSGCVVWVVFDESTLELGPFYVFGGRAGESITGLENLKTAKHTKGNKDGHKAERPNIKVLNKGQFLKVPTIELVYDFLFREGFSLEELASSARISPSVGNKNEFTKLNRIKLWAERPHQVNHQIIRAFLTLQNENDLISVSELEQYCSKHYKIDSFKSNLIQMTTDAGNSHGKVFAINGDVLVIWPEAQKEIQKYFR
jgi:hypothetical protein